MSIRGSLTGCPILLSRVALETYLIRYWVSGAEPICGLAQDGHTHFGSVVIADGTEVTSREEILIEQTSSPLHHKTRSTSHATRISSRVVRVACWVLRGGCLEGGRLFFFCILEA